MIDPHPSSQLRRDFLLRGLPLCALSGLALARLPLLGQTAAQRPPAAPATHKFDAEMPRKLTLRLAFRMQYGAAFIPYLEFCVKAAGREAVIANLKAYADDGAGPGAADNAKRLGGNSFAHLKKLFAPTGGPPFGSTLTFTVAEDTDTVHELKVTECLWARTFLDAKAGDLGYAGICFGDYAFAKAFNPAIEMVRDKTLMQGHDCCNHRYLWKG
jgi:hypothetical protein